MSSLPLDKNAADLNRVLREHGKKLGKTWRIRIRKLLSETFAALSAPKLDGDRCNALGEQIDRELAWVHDPASISEEALVSAFDKMMGEVAAMQKPTFGNIPGNIEKEKPHIIDASDEDAPKPPKENDSSREITVSPLLLDKSPELNSPEKAPSPDETKVKTKPAKAKKSAKSSDTRKEQTIVPETPISEHPAPAENAIEQPETVQSDVPSADTTPAHADDSKSVAKIIKEVPPEIGYFDLVSVQVRQFFKFRALVETYEIGRTTTFAEKFCDSVEKRIEKFIAVLSGPDESASHFSTDVVTGYRDDLIKDMPDRDLVLHPKKKKKKQ